MVDVSKKIVFTAKAQSTQRCYFFAFVGERPTNANQQALRAAFHEKSKLEYPINFN